MLQPVLLPIIFNQYTNSTGKLLDLIDINRNWPVDLRVKIFVDLDEGERCKGKKYRKGEESVSFFRYRFV